MASKHPNHDEQVVLEHMRAFYRDCDIVIEQLKEYFDSQGESKLYEPTLRLSKIANEQEKHLSRTQELERYDTTPDKWARRERAALNKLSEAQKKLRSVYEPARIAASWGHTSGLHLMGGYDHRDERGHHLLMGAAIWILDLLYKDDRRHELLAIMPENIIPMPLRDGVEKPFHAMPLVNHPIHELEDIWELTQLLMNRNAELVHPAMVHRSLTDEWTVSIQRRSTEGCTQRSVFEQIIAILDEKAVQLAAQRFEQKVWEFYRLVFRADQMVEDELNKLLRRADKLEARLQAENARKNFPIGPVVSMPDIRKCNTTTSLQNQLQQEFREAQYQADDYRMKIGSFFTDMALPNDREKHLKKFKDLFPSDLYQQLLNFAVDDPYETCFAVLYLLDSGSDIPWLYYGARAVVYTAMDQLPFAVLDGSEPKKADYSSAEIRSIHRHQYSCQGKYKGETDGDNDPVNREKGLNLAQLLYKHTGVVWPRYHSAEPVPDKLQQAFQQLEKDGEDVHQMLLSLLSNGNMKACAPALMNLFAPGETREEPREETVQQTLAELCCRQQRDIKGLRAQSYKGEREHKKLQKEYDQLADEAERMRQELAELRESVYHVQNEQSLPEAKEQSAISFPFHTQARIISFGGHPSWLSNIRSLLPDVRFISPDRLPDENLIRNADAVWLQPNCMSHSDFFRIINVVRNENKRLHYFAWVSAEKCAEQLAVLENGQKK